MDNKGVIVPAAQASEVTSKTFEQVSISKDDGLKCKGQDQTDGECDNYYIGKISIFYQFIIMKNFHSTLLSGVNMGQLVCMGCVFEKLWRRDSKQDPKLSQ